MKRDLNLLQDRKNYFIVFLLSGILLLDLSRIANAGRVNRWSIQLLKSVSGNDEVDFINIPEPPPFHKRSSLWLAELALDQGYWDETQEYIDSKVEAGDKDALLILGKLHAARGSFIDAVQIHYESEHYQALLKLSAEAENESDYISAVIAGEAAWNLNPEDMATRLSYLLEKADRIDEARLMLMRMVDDYPSSPSMSKWLLRIGDLSRQQTLWEDAEYFYQKAIDMEPDNQQARIGLGWVYYEKGFNLEITLAKFQEASFLGSDPGPVYYAIGRILTKEQRYPEAESYYLKAVDLNPDNRWWSLARANNLRLAGNLSEAINLYKNLILSNPDWYKVYFEIAWLHKLNNNPDDAIWAIEHALLLQDKEVYSNYLRAGKIYEWAGMTDIALGVYQQALSLNPDAQAAKLAIDRLSESAP